MLVSGSSPVLIAPPNDTHRIVWEGADPESAAQAARRLGIQRVESRDLKREISTRLRGCARVFCQGSHTESGRILHELSLIPAHNRTGLPLTFADAEVLLTPLRLIKDRSEISAISAAGMVTSAALAEIAALVRPGVTEREIAATLEFSFKLKGAEVAFPSIVATGRNAATLHYRHLSGTLKRDDLLLVDLGAELQLYAADITRVFPVSGRFTAVQRTLYQAVRNAQQAAISVVRAGVRAQAVYDAAVEELVEGLKKLKVLKGTTKTLIKAGAFKPYFPHGIGHTLGIDVHDVGSLRGNNQARLERGMVITIEPGLYFRSPVGLLPASGVRIEDDVLVTDSGARLLTKFPSECDEIEALLARSRRS